MTWLRGPRNRAALLLLAMFAGLLWAGSSAGTLLVVQQDVTSPEVVIALGSHENERLPAAARLALRWQAATVLLTEPVWATEHNCFRCSERVAWLEQLGVPASRVVVLPKRVENTHDEALAVAEYRRTRPFARAAVVTSPYHTRRARAVFASVLGADVALGIYPASANSPAVPGRWWRAAYDRRYVPYEWAAIVWYAVRYGVNPLAVVAASAQ